MNGLVAKLCRDIAERERTLWELYDTVQYNALIARLKGPEGYGRIYLDELDKEIAKCQPNTAGSQ